MNILPLQVTVKFSFDQNNQIKPMNRTAEGGIVCTALCRVEISCEVVQRVGGRSDGRLKVLCLH